MVALDLRHVASPALRDLIHLPDFDRAHQQIDRLVGCTEPVRLLGQTTTIDTATGEVLRSYTTADEPTGSLLTACGNRRASRCPACSRVYAADTFHLIRAGLTGGKSVPDTVRTHPRVFATLTAPSFGPVHNHPTDAGGVLRPCRCGKRHEPADALLGTPLDPKTYDYPGTVLFNAHAGALWARFTIYLRREIAARLGLTQKAARAVLRVSFAKVAEYQKRGLVHFHAVIRLDGPDVYGTTRKEALAKLTEKIATSNRGVPVVSAQGSVAAYLTYWLENVAIHQLRETTHTRYTACVNHYLIPGLGKKKLAKLAAKDVRT